MREAVSTSAAPAAIGPYSQAVRAGSLVFVSGQIPLDPATGTMVAGDIAVQTHRVLRNLAGILEAAGSSLDRVVISTVASASRSTRGTSTAASRALDATVCACMFA